MLDHDPQGQAVVVRETRMLTPALSEAHRTVESLAGQLATSSQRLYRLDVGAFFNWLAEQGVAPLDVTYDVVTDYRAHLNWLMSEAPKGQRIAKATAARKLSIARRFLAEATRRRLFAHNPAEGVRGFKSSDDASPYRALTIPEMRVLLATCDPETHAGRRDQVILSLAGRLGLRRAEIAGLNQEDVQTEQGHWTVMVRHGKGDKRRVVKVPPDVYRLIVAYWEALDVPPVEDDDGVPLLVRINKSDRITGERLRGEAIERIVTRRAHRMDPPLALTPHDLRATFATLALEGGARLHDVQYAMGHADPRTTERYQRRKLNLDNHAVDYIKL